MGHVFRAAWRAARCPPVLYLLGLKAHESARHAASATTSHHVDLLNASVLLKQLREGWRNTSHNGGMPLYARGGARARGARGWPTRLQGERADAMAHTGDAEGGERQQLRRRGAKCWWSRQRFRGAGASSSDRMLLTIRRSSSALPAGQPVTTRQGQHNREASLFSSRRGA